MNASRYTLFAAAAAIAALTLAAAEPTTPAGPRNASPSLSDTDYSPLPVGVGLRVFIDPETGKLRMPTAAERAAMAADASASKNKSVEGLEVEYRSDGSKHVDLQGRFMHSLRVTINPDGSTSFVCTDRHPEQATPVSAPAKPAEK